jgi:hypothetical protein
VYTVTYTLARHNAERLEQGSHALASASGAGQLVCNRMTRLVAAAQDLGLTADVALGGRWIAIHGDRATVYAIEAAWGVGFFVWCDVPGARGVERYADATEAIEAGLRRARHSPDRPPGDGSPDLSSE